MHIKGGGLRQHLWAAGGYAADFMSLEGNAPLWYCGPAGDTELQLRTTIVKVPDLEENVTFNERNLSE